MDFDDVILKKIKTIKITPILRELISDWES